MTEQQTHDPVPAQSAPPSAPPAEHLSAPPAAPRRTVGIRVLIASTVGAFVIGGLVGSGFGALIGYVAHPDDTVQRPPFQQGQQGQDVPQPPGLGSGQSEGQAPSTS